MNRPTNRPRTPRTSRCGEDSIGFGTLSRPLAARTGTRPARFAIGLARVFAGLCVAGGWGWTGTQAAAQCVAPAWLPEVGTPGADAVVSKMQVWDPDGAGPAAPLVIVGGSFANIGGISASGIAAYDPATGAWSPLGLGLAGGSVNSMTIASNGDLVVGGNFTTAGGSTVNRVARWNGSAWTSFAGGLNSTVGALVTMPNGDLIAGGAFTAAVGGASTGRLARWTGSAWVQALNASPHNTVTCLHVRPNGDVIASGVFAYIVSNADLSTGHIARWDGTAWRSMGGSSTAGPFGQATYAMVELPSGELAVGGDNLIKRWDGTAWSDIGPGIRLGSALALAVAPTGDLVMGGSVTLMGAVAVNRAIVWNGAAWSTLGSGINNYANAMVLLPDGDALFGGQFTTAGGVTATRLARYDFGVVAPVVAVQPGSTTVCPGGQATIAIGVSGSVPRTYQWQVRGEGPACAWANVVDGVNPGPCGGGDDFVASGSTTPVVTSSTWIETQVSHFFRCIVTNSCGTATSDSATVSICVADLDDGTCTHTCDGGVTIDDLLCYLNSFEVGTLDADVDDGSGTGTPDGGVTIDDLLYYLQRFEAGC